MDPISGAVLAGEILTLVHFSWNIVNGTYDTYQSASGLSPDHARLDDVIQDLQNAMKALHCDVDPSSPHGQALTALAADCEDVCGELIQVLVTLQRKDGNKLWTSVQATWNRMRKDKEVRDIVERLSEYRSQIFLRLNLIMRDQLTAMNSRQEDMQRQGLHLPDEERARLSEVQQSVTRLAEEFERQRCECNSIEEDELPQQSKSLDDLCAALSTVVAELQKAPAPTIADNAILQRLFFHKIDAREQQIDPAEYGTFKWLLESDNRPSAEEKSSGSSPERHSDAVSTVAAASSNNFDERYISIDTNSQRIGQHCFRNWLRSDSCVFDISGKAGSGKSTLMKLICQHPHVEQDLKSWAGEKSLITARFFFWASGNEQQRSLEGLYRSLLHGTLQKCPELIRVVFPGEWEALTTNPVLGHHTPFTLGELKDAMEMLVTKSISTHRICFFIDGLDEYDGDEYDGDEYDGDSTDHLSLARKLAKWTMSLNVKICASSRPHWAGMYGPAETITLHLDRGNADDIRRFTYEAIMDENPAELEPGDLTRLINQITRSSDGVFLWARLVTRSMLEGLRHGDSTRILLEKLSRIPQGLEALFDQLFNGIDVSDRRRSDKILLIAMANNYVAPHSLRTPKPLNALCYSWIDDLSDPEFPLKDPILAFSDVEIRERHELVSRQLRLLTKGLLEMRKSDNPTGSPLGNDIYYLYEVDFYHRSVEDYLKEPTRMSQMRQRIGVFESLDALRRIRLAGYKFSRPPPKGFPRSSLSWYFGLTDDYLVQYPEPLLPTGDDAFLSLAKEHHRVFEHHHEETPTWGSKYLLPSSFKHHIPCDEWGPGFSYIHRLVANQNKVYLEHLLSQDPSIATPVDERLAPEDIDQRSHGLSLLLTSCAAGQQPAIVEALLKHGASPNHHVVVRRTQGKDTSGFERTTIWAVFLHIFIHKLQEESPSLFISQGLFHKDSWASWFSIMEMFLRAGADGDCIICFRRADREAAGLPSDERFPPITHLPESAVMTLENLVFRLRPSNMEAILQHLSPARSSGPWSATTELASAITSLSLRPSQPWHQKHIWKTEQADLDEVFGNPAYSVANLCFQDANLEPGFWFRVY